MVPLFSVSKTIWQNLSPIGSSIGSSVALYAPRVNVPSNPASIFPKEPMTPFLIHVVLSHSCAQTSLGILTLSMVDT